MSCSDTASPQTGILQRRASIMPLHRPSNRRRPGILRSAATLTRVAALLLALPSALAGQSVADADVASVDAIITAVYDAISGEAGEARDWDRFRSLFAEGATLSAVATTPAGELRRVVMTPESYIERSGPALEQGGFIEAEIGRVTERFASIAHAFSAYESYRSASDA